MQFTTVIALVAGLAQAQAEKRLDEKLTALAKPKLMIIDELAIARWNPTRRVSSSSAGATRRTRCSSRPTKASRNGAPVDNAHAATTRNETLTQ